MRRVVFALVSCCAFMAFAADDASVAALKSKIKVADVKNRIGPGYLVTSPGTLLIVQKEGLAVGWAGTFRRRTRLENGRVVTEKPTGRPLRTGEGVFIYKVESTPTVLILSIVTADKYDSDKPGHGEQRIEFAYDNPLAQVGTVKVLEDIGEWLKTEGESSVARRIVEPPLSPAPTAQASSPTPESVDPGLTNEGVVALVEADLGDEIVIAKLKNAPKVTFDLSTEALQSLKKAKVSSPVIAAMIERAARPGADAATRSGHSEKPEDASSKAAPRDPCADIELMGLFKEDMRPMSPLIIYQAKVRNASTMTKIVRLEWLDMYAQAMQSTTQIGAGQIVTLQLAAQEPFQRQPINLRLASCR